MTTPAPRHLNAVPHPGLFIGRQDDLGRIHQCLQAAAQPALLVGLGGIGKTSTALAYAHSPAAHGTYQQVACFFVSSQPHEAVLNDSLLLTNLGIAAQVNATRSTGDEAAAFAQVIATIQALPGRTLLLFDNLEDADHLPRFLANFDPHRCALLCTSRHEIARTQPLRLDELPAPEATDLFGHLYYDGQVPPAAAQDPHIADILRHLDRHTLLLHMVALAGQEAGYALPQLAQFVRDQYIRHQHLQIAVDTGRINDPDETKRARIHALVTGIFAELSQVSDHDQTYLRYFALLPSTPHDFEDLAILFQVPETDQPDLRGTLLRLRRRGLLLEKGGTVSGEAKAWALHRMLREVVVERLRPSVENCGKVVEVVTQLLRIDQTKDNPVDKFPWVEYGEAVLAVLGGEEVEEIAMLLGNLGAVYEDMGVYQKAAGLMAKALAIDLYIHGEAHSQVATRSSNLGDVYRALGNHATARDLLLLALDALVKNFGELHPNVATSRSNLASVYRELGEHATARDLLLLAIESGVKNFGEIHPLIATYYNNLAHVHQTMGDYPQAKAYFQKAEGIIVQAFGEQHPNVATVRRSMAKLAAAMGETEP